MGDSGWGCVFNSFISLFKLLDPKSFIIRFPYYSSFITFTLPTTLLATGLIKGLLKGTLFLNLILCCVFLITKRPLLLNASNTASFGGGLFGMGKYRWCELWYIT